MKAYARIVDENKRQLNYLCCGRISTESPLRFNFVFLGRREELTGPPRGLVKNLRGLFENPQGFEARKG